MLPRGTSWVTLALDRHTSRSQDKTRKSLSEWLDRDIAGWQINLLLKLRGSAIERETLEAISEMGVAPEKTPEAVQLCQASRFHTLCYDGSASGTYKYLDLPDLVGRRVLVGYEPSANKLNKIWKEDKSAVVVEVAPDTKSYDYRDVFGWEAL